MANFAEEIQSSFTSIKIKAMLNVMYTSNHLSSAHNDFFKPFGISPQQYNILRILKGAKKPMKVQEVKNRMIERSPNLTRLTDKLCDKELIVRIPFPTDRRVVLVEITSKGLDLLSQIQPEDSIAELLSKITEEEAELLSNLLDKMR